MGYGQGYQGGYAPNGGIYPMAIDPNRPFLLPTVVTATSHLFDQRAHLGPQELDVEQEVSHRAVAPKRVKRSTYVKQVTTAVQTDPTPVFPTTSTTAQPQNSALPPMYPPPVRPYDPNRFDLERIGIRLGWDDTWKPFIPDPALFPTPGDTPPPPRDNEALAKQAAAAAIVLPTKSSEYSMATYKLWKVWAVVQFMQNKKKIMEGMDRKEYYKEYYKSDGNAFLDQSILLLKARLGLLLKEVEEDEVLDLSSNTERLQEIIDNILDELSDVCSASKPADFDNALVLSFLSSISLSGSYLPPKLYTAYLSEHISLSSTGQMEFVSSDMSSAMIGEYIIVRVLAINILLVQGEDLSEQAQKNKAIIASILCRAFITGVNGLEMDEGKGDVKGRGQWTPGEEDNGIGTDEDEGEEGGGEGEEDADIGQEEYSPIDGLEEVDELGIDLDDVKDKIMESLNKLHELCKLQRKSEMKDKIDKKVENRKQFMEKFKGQKGMEKYMKKLDMEVKLAYD